MSSYQIGIALFQLQDPDAQQRLGHAHQHRLRPLCICQQPPAPMYVARTARGYLVKRMPGTGHQHAASCDAYEPDPLLSGAGALLGQAIQEDLDSGLTSLKLDFSLRKQSGRAPPPPTDATPAVATAKPSRLSLRGLLHYLYDKAALNRWSPSMAGKRNWYVVRKYLLQAAESALAKNSPLGELLYIPETFRAEDRNEIGRRRTLRLAPAQGPGNAKQLMVLVGDVKEFAPTRYGHKLVVKHAPDFGFMMDETMYAQIQKRFAAELSIWGADDSVKLLVIGTFGLSAAGVATLHQVSMMLVTAEWLPFESLPERQLLDALVEQKRRFVKSLRFNLHSDNALASAVLTDGPKPTALYLVDSTPHAAEALDALLSESTTDSWRWPLSEEMPPLPSI